MFSPYSSALDFSPTFCYSKMAEVVDAMLQFSGHSNSLTARSTSDDVGSSQLTNFHRFPDLPKELRQRVFEACLPSRVFRFTYEKLPTTGSKSNMDLSEKPSALPCIAFVCRDAYEISKLYVKEYRVDFTHIFSVQEMQYLYTTTRIRFDPVLDSLLVNYSGATSDDDPVEGHLEHETYLEGLHDGPYALAMSPKVNIVLDMDKLVGPRRDDTLVSDIRWLTTRPYSDCLTQHSHCTIRLATTKLTTTSQEIRSSGLFGMFGEERNVLIDIKDTAKIDRYEDYIYQLFPRVRQNFIRSCNYFPEDEPASGDLACIGASRYGTDYGADEGVITDDWHTRDDDSEEPPTVFSTLAEKDAANAHALIKQTWLESHHCFEPAKNPALPWTGDTKYRKWDDEHHVAKHWLSKLPTFSFVVMYTVSEED